MVDRTPGCAIWRVWAVWDSARPAAGAGRTTSHASRRQPAADASSISGRLPPRPRAASSRPERTISWHQPSSRPAPAQRKVCEPTTQPGPNGPDPGTGGCGAVFPRIIWITAPFASDGVITEAPP
jgi:hypothetical protein